jgi:hypothetical protein
MMQAEMEQEDLLEKVETEEPYRMIKKKEEHLIKKETIMRKMNH